MMTHNAIHKKGWINLGGHGLNYGDLKFIERVRVSKRFELYFSQQFLLQNTKDFEIFGPVFRVTDAFFVSPDPFLVSPKRFSVSQDPFYTTVNICLVKIGRNCKLLLHYVYQSQSYLNFWPIVKRQVIYLFIPKLKRCSPWGLGMDK